jgi:hypothetical protein
MLLIITYVLVAILALVAIYYLFIGSDQELVIDESGILDPSLGVGLIEWEDVVDAHIDTNYNQQYLSVHVRNAEKYLSRLGEPRRSKYVMHRNLGFTSFSVPISAEGLDPMTLLHEVKVRIKKN